MNEIIEYIAIGAEVYAITEAGAEQFVARCESGERAERLAANLNDRLAGEEVQS